MASTGPIVQIDKSHQKFIKKYYKKITRREGSKIDVDDFSRHYLAFVNMGVEEFNGHLTSLKINIKNLGENKTVNLRHSMRAAIPFHEIKAEAKYEADNVEYAAKMALVAERMRALSGNIHGGDHTDPDERVRAGTHKRIRGEPEPTGAGKGQKQSLEYIVPVEDDSDDDGVFD